jgi:hypothetical protein
MRIHARLQRADLGRGYRSGLLVAETYLLNNRENQRRT